MTNPGHNRSNRASLPISAIAGESTWKRFSSALQLSYGYAQQQAVQESAAELTPEHLLRGMLRIDADQANGVRLIQELGATVEQIDARLPQTNATVVWPPQPVSGRAGATALILSSGSQLVTHESLSNADAMGHERVGTEHLLIALLSVPEPSIAQALIPCGITQAACRERLGAWLMNGSYKLEKAAPIAQATAIGNARLLQSIFTVRRWASLIYLFWVLGIWMGSLIVPMPYNVWLQVLYSVTVYPLMYFIVPYIISTYTLNYLLRSRFDQGLNGMPPKDSMKGLALPFGLNALLGIGMLLGALPYTAGLIGGHIATLSFGPLPLPVIILQWAFLANCVTLMVTHWLLTLNVR